MKRLGIVLIALAMLGRCATTILISIEENQWEKAVQFVCDEGDPLDGELFPDAVNTISEV